MSFGVDNPTTGMLLATAIGLQNMPEGLAVALPLLREGYGKGRAVAYATLSGLVEPGALLAGVLTVPASKALLPLSLAFAAGAMLYVVFDEIMPESHGRGYHKEATFGALLKPRHQFVYPSADSSRLCWSDINPEISKHRFARV